MFSTRFVGLLAVAVLAASSAAQAAVTPGFVLEYDAGQDTAGDRFWDENYGTAGYRWYFGTEIISASPVTVNDATRPGLTRAYDFSTTPTAFQPSTSEFMGGDTTLEVWFKPDNLTTTNAQVIFEFGGDQSGTSLVLDGNELVATTQTGNSSRRARTSHALASADHFIHAVMSIDNTQDTLYLYVDGVLTNSGGTQASGALDALSGGNEAALGGIGGGGLTGVADFNSPGDLDGQIAMFRLYDSYLSGAQVAANYNAVAATSIPEPAMISMLGLAVAGFRRR